MKALILKNGTRWDINQNSSVSDIILVSDNRDSIFSLYDLLTEDNLSEFSIDTDGVVQDYANYVCAGIRMNNSTTITAHIVLTKKVSDLVKNLEEQIDYWRNKQEQSEKEYSQEIHNLSEENQHLSSVIDDKLVVVDGDITNLQEAVVEVYEMIAGGTL